MHAGVLARNNFKETSNAVKDEECGVVDEKKTATGGIQAESPKLRETSVGSDAGR